MRRRSVVVTENIKGQNFAIHLNGDGVFFTEYQGEQYKAPTLKALRNRIRTIISGTQKLNILFTAVGHSWWSDAKLLHGVIVGVHDGNNNLLVKYEGRAKTEQESRSSDKFMRRFTAAETAEHNKLNKAVTAAEKALEKFKKDRVLKDPEFLSLARR